VHGATGILQLACGAVSMHDLNDFRLAEERSNQTGPALPFLYGSIEKHGVLGCCLLIDCAAVGLGWWV